MASERIKLLVVEDSDADFRLVSELLNDFAPALFEISRSKNMAGALKIIAENRFDAALLDLNLPDSKGLSIIDNISGIQPGIAMLVFTDLDDEKSGIDALHKGAEDYLVKGSLQGELLSRCIRYAIERKRAKENIARAKEEWERTFNSVPDMIAILDTRHRIIRVNNSMAKHLEIKPEQCIGMPCYKYLHGLDKPHDLCPHSATLKDGKEHVQEIHEDYLGMDLFVSTTPLMDNNGEMVGSVHVARDITERKKVEEGLKWAEQRNRILSESTAELLMSNEPQEVVDSVCEKVMKFLDCQVFFNFISVIENNKLRLNAYSGVSWGEAQRIEWLDYGSVACDCATARDGERVRIEDIQNKKDPRADLVRGYGVKAYCCHPLKIGEKTVGTISFGTTKRDKFSEAEISMMRAVADIVAVAMRRKQAEEVLRRDKETVENIVKERTKELMAANIELDKARRLSDIGTLAATVAHELRNPLAAIRMAAYNIKRKKQDLPIDSHLANIEKKVTESDQIINNLLFYSRLRVSHFEEISIYDCLNECIELSAKQHQEQAAVVEKHIQSIQAETIHADPLQIKEVFNNILNNAFDAVADRKGRIVVKAELNGRETLRVFIEDNGIGMDDEQRKRALEPFFTTKAKGTGLGLSVCSQIIVLHSGSLDIASKKGEGTTVIITLPTRQDLNAKTNPYSGRRQGTDV